MRKIIVDNRMHNRIKEYFVSLGYEVLSLEKQDTVYSEISSHVDIFFSKIGENIVYAKNLVTKNISLKHFLKGEKEVSSKYPDDTPYNVALVGKKCICKEKNVDETVKKLLKDGNYSVINVEQGYANCSIANVSENSCITTDKGIYNALIKEKVDVLYIKEENIKLLNKDGYSKMHGFIGGATALLNNKFIVFGDVKKLTESDKICEYIKKYNLELVDFPGLDVIDLGGILEV